MLREMFVNAAHFLPSSLPKQLESQKDTEQKKMGSYFFLDTDGDRD